MFAAAFAQGRQQPPACGNDDGARKRLTYFFFLPFTYSYEDSATHPFWYGLITALHLMPK